MPGEPSLLALRLNRSFVHKCQLQQCKCFVFSPHVYMYKGGLQAACQAPAACSRTARLLEELLGYRTSGRPELQIRRGRGLGLLLSYPRGVLVDEGEGAGLIEGRPDGR